MKSTQVSEAANKAVETVEARLAELDKLNAQAAELAGGIE
jgi:hypothetical protein